MVVYDFRDEDLFGDGLRGRVDDVEAPCVESAQDVPVFHRGDVAHVGEVGLGGIEIGEGLLSPPQIVYPSVEPS